MADDSGRSRILALAAIFQGAALVTEIATEGKTRQRYFNASLASLLSLTEDGVDDIYGGVSYLKPGLDNLEAYLGSRGGDEHFPLTLDYARALIRLTDMMMSDAGKVGLVAEEIETLRKNHGSARRVRIPLPLVRDIAKVYFQHFSSLPEGYRIRVRGKKEYLTPTDNVARIRAALLAGIRAAVLWRHVGGRLPIFGKRILARQVSALRQQEEKAE